MWKKFEIYSIKKISFGQKRPCILHDFVPRGIFLQFRGGRVLKKKCPIPVSDEGEITSRYDLA